MLGETPNTMSTMLFDAPKELQRVYLVGGAVRDKLLGVESHDRDFVVVGESTEKMQNLGFQSVGDDFPVYLHPKTKEEYALARTERKTGSGYRGFAADASTNITLEDDLARRDLTINSMAMDKHGRIFDPYNGQKDLTNKVLKHTTDSFAEDPVRVLRVARFYARLGPQWHIDESTKLLMRDMYNNGELTHLVAERVYKETERALMEPYPHLFFETLIDFGIFPELANMRGVPQPFKHHPEGDVFVHTMLVVQRAADLNFDLPTRFAALTHDFGKPVAFDKYGKLFQHEQLGIEAIEAFSQRLKVPKKLTEIAKLMSENHTQCHKIRELTPEKLHTFLIDNMNAVKNEARFLQFLNACLCDAQGRGLTMVNNPYPQLEIAKSYLRSLQGLDAKQIVKNAIAKGIIGKQISDEIRIAEIDNIRVHQVVLSSN
ncbi:MAG: tRNA nucleotidyltransferase (CCA-adding enzyme) [Gammaproteobacteria bacterium]|jgi:tRNA nucleotidyltransferase (CCA-adding enzyme)